MKSLKILSSKLAAPSKVIVGLFLLFAAIGFIDATYLTVKHFLGTPISCTLLHGCEQVTNSEYSVILGIPLALLGALYYFSILILVALYIQTENKIFFQIASVFTICGFLTSLLLVYLQIFVIGASAYIAWVQQLHLPYYLSLRLAVLKKNLPQKWHKQKTGLCKACFLFFT